MKILALGDIVGTRMVEQLSRELAERLLDGGVDLLTSGNHIWGKRDLVPLLEEESRVLRPANYPPAAPGSGGAIIDVCGWRMLCINVMGTVFTDQLADPFDTVEKILARESGSYDLALLDIHAEATAEKLALARVFDGRINIIFGTHTHVQTADECILPRGTGYITDLGMCGPVDGILGTDAEAVIRKFRTHMPQKFTPAQGKLQLQGALFELDGAMKVKKVERVRIHLAPYPQK